MDTFTKIELQLHRVKRIDGKFPRAMFVDAEELRMLKQDMKRRGSPPNSKHPKVLGVPVKEFEFVTNRPDTKEERIKEMRDDPMAFVHFVFRGMGL